MNHRAMAAAVFALVLSLAPALKPGVGSRAQAAKPDGPAVAFVNVSVVPMDSNRVLERQTVIVRGQRVAELGPAFRVEVPEGARRIEGRGRYLMPGLAEMHAHLPGQQAGEDAARYVFLLYLANGVTTVRGMLGQPWHLDLRRRVASGELLGPRIYAAGPAFSGNTVTSVEQAERLVAEQKQAGYDHLKVHSGLAREVYDAIAAKASQLGIPFAGHVSVHVGLQRALEAGQASIEHLDSYLQALEADDSPIRNADAQTRQQQLVRYLDERKIRTVAEATRKARVWNAPTLFLWQTFLSAETPEQLAQRFEVRYALPQWRSAWERQRQSMLRNLAPEEDRRRIVQVRNQLVRALRDTGAKLLLASDSPQLYNVPGFSLHREMAAMVAAGLSPYQVLEAGTRNPAEFLKSADFGTIAVGKEADLILLEADPLRDVGNVASRAGVMVRGRWFTQSELNQQVETLLRKLSGD